MNGQTRPQTESALENRELAGSQQGPFGGINPCARGLGEGASRLDGGGCVPHVGFPEVRATSWEGLVGKPWVGGNQAPGRQEEKADQGLRSGSGGGGAGNPQSGSAIPGLSIQLEAPQRVSLAPTSPDPRPHTRQAWYPSPVASPVPVGWVGSAWGGSPLPRPWHRGRGRGEEPQPAPHAQAEAQGDTAQRGQLGLARSCRAVPGGQRTRRLQGLPCRLWRAGVACLSLPGQGPQAVTPRQQVHSVRPALAARTRVWGAGQAKSPPTPPPVPRAGGCSRPCPPWGNQLRGWAAQGRRAMPGPARSSRAAPTSVSLGLGEDSSGQDHGRRALLTSGAASPGGPRQSGAG
ncbi:skin secretory protein xP2-like [Mustela erminea]|uniref:skin secretory protein xP2-like n=1 Tax=Mustela erminea TaxID=36723 RepID=UPI00138690EC|nr:skin secretory protein xP2-like [Mustela erminea]